tara:strand:- start:299 stop:604 length:306 start_codon:yes stop_codon:yes gene_type:complete
MSVGIILISYSTVIITVSVKIPQIYHTCKTKKTDDLSMAFLLLTLLTHFLWITYGIIDDFDLTIIATDSICLFFTIQLIIMKILYDKKNKLEKNIETIENL